MIGTMGSSLGEVFEVCNEYTFRKWFFIRCDKLMRSEVSEEVRSRGFCYSKQGFKRCLRKKGMTFAKWCNRFNCHARANFYIKANGEWICKKHNTIHNHELILEYEVHRLRAHKKVEKAYVVFFNNMRRNGIKVFHA